MPWCSTVATVIDCRQRLIALDSGASTDGFSPEYIITYSFVVAGKTYKDRYTAGTPQMKGHQLEILFNPLNPKQNTGNDSSGDLRVRILAWIIGGALAFSLIWLSHRAGIDQFPN